MKIKMHFKSAWWWKPALRVVYLAAVCRLISLSTAQKLASAIANSTFKWRIGKKWQKVTGIHVTAERQ